MNRHQRRAAAAQCRQQERHMRQERREPVMWVGLNSPIPMDIKADIARCVRAITWDTAAQDCSMRASLGKWVLWLLGFEAELTAGSLLFRAGFDPTRDVCAFHGPNNTGIVDRNGFLLGHIWLEMDGEIIDFTSGDWDAITAADADIEPTGLGEVVWVRSPPEFVWANKTLFKWKPVGAPELGECWYGPFSSEISIPPNDLIAEAIAATEVTMRENLTTLNLFDRCRSLTGTGAELEAAQ
jgi:hypothetical protein